MFRRTLEGFMRETKTVQQHNGIIMTYFPQNGCWVRAYEDGSFSWEPANMVYAKELVKNPRVVLDIGANIGQESVQYASWAQKVFSFEPVPVIFEVLSQNIRQNNFDNVTLYNFGCGNTKAKLNARFQEANEGSTYICEKPGKNNVEVEIILVDDLLPSIENVDFVKIDVEGFELFVLQGMEKTLRNNYPVLQIEAIDSHLKRNGTDSLEIYDFLFGLGYNTVTTHLGKELSREECLRENRTRADLFFQKVTTPFFMV